jgi:phosphoglycolate phosphatase-like HAD superfamily hydrolase
MKTAIFDLDGTLVHMPKKVWLADEFNWDNFIEWMNTNDPVKQAVTMLIWHHVQGHRITVVTARPEFSRAATELLLANHHICIDRMIMRTAEEVAIETEELVGASSSDEVNAILFRNHSVYRERVMAELQTEGELSGYAYDDQKDNLDVWRKAGMSCWFVNDKGLITGYHGK